MSVYCFDKSLVDVVSYGLGLFLFCLGSSDDVPASGDVVHFDDKVYKVRTSGLFDDGSFGCVCSHIG